MVLAGALSPVDKAILDHYYLNKQTNSIPGAYIVDRSLPGIKLIEHTITGQELGQNSVSNYQVAVSALAANRIAGTAITWAEALGGMTQFLWGDFTGGNYLSISTNGFPSFAGSARNWTSIHISGFGMTVGASAPDLDTFGPSGNLLAYRFAGVTTIEQMFFSIELPHSWDTNTAIHPHVHWTPVNASTGHVDWALEYSWQSEGGTYVAPTTLLVTQATAAVAWNSQRSEFQAISGPGVICSIIVCRLYRPYNNIGDTYAFDAALIDFAVALQNDTLGSRLEDEK